MSHDLKTDAGVLDRIQQFRVLPVAVIEDVACAAPLGEALKAAGLACIEVTLRTRAALAALAELAQDTGLLVGAGTVIRADQVASVVAAGARFIVSPGFSPSVVAACQAAGVPVLPGVATATEILMALDVGLDCVKFFPAETSGGVAALAALSAAYGSMRFVPTGGITVTNLPTYLRHSAVVAVGGSWMVSPALLNRGRFDEVTRLAAEAVAVAALAPAGGERPVQDHAAR